MPHRSSAVKRNFYLKPQDVVFIGSGLLPVVWTDHNEFDLLAFIDDMDALGFPVWVTPTTVYVYAGDEQ